MEVTLNESPTEQIIAKAVTACVIIDSRGRRIALKKPGVLAQYRIVEVIGESAKNEVYMGMILPLIYVASIDDDAVFQPGKKSELEALIQRLDDDGINAVMKGVQDNFGAVDPDADKDKLKN